jgi:hypothetical protein
MSGGSYFGGSSLQKTNEVRRLAAANFKELVERFFNNHARLPYKRAEFLAHPDRDKLKDTSFISPVTYPYDESGPRGNAHADKLVLGFLDMDEGDFVKDLLDDPKAVLEHLWPLDCVLHTTAKHTPEAPRLKLVVPIDPTDPANLPRIIRHLAGRIGIPNDFKGVAESSVPAQGHYRPVRFEGEQAASILASRTNGISLDVDCLPPEEDEFLDGKRYAHGETGDDSLGLTNLPIPGIESVDDVRELFNHLDPDCSRLEWLVAAAAMHHQFGYDEEQARSAYDLFVEWSSNGSKFRGEVDTYKLWRSLRPYPQGRDPVTMRSLIKRAMDAGWDGGTLAKREKESLEGWIAGCDDAEELMRTGPARIAAMAISNEIITDAMVMAIRRRLKELTGDNLEKRAIYREVARERKRGRAERQKDLPSTPTWLLPFCYIAVDRCFHDYGSGVSLSPPAFNEFFAKELMPTDPGDLPANAKPPMLPSDFALNVAGLPRVYKGIYCPKHGGEDPFFEFDGQTYLNTFNPISVPVADPERALQAGLLWDALIAGYTHDPVCQRIIKDYAAFIVQHLGEKIRWLLMLQGAEGIGKGLIVESLANAIGRVNCKGVSSSLLRTDFNDWATGAALIAINEMHIPGEMREKVMNALKEVITDDYIVINQKYKDAQCRVPNWANLIVMTNFFDGAHLKESDRRWCPIKSDVQTKAQVKALSANGHFERVSVLKTPEWAGALRYHLLRHEISPDFPVNGPAPITNYRQELIEESKNPLQVAIEDLLADNDPLYSEDVISAAHLSAALPHDLKRNAAKVSHYLTILGYERALDQRVRVAGVRTTLWTHREKFVPALGSPEDVLRARLEAEGSPL